MWIYIFCSSEFTPQATIDHPYPCTKLMWCPDPVGQYPDLVATSGDYLRSDADLSGLKSSEFGLEYLKSTRTCRRVPGRNVC